VSQSTPHIAVGDQIKTYKFLKLLNMEGYLDGEGGPYFLDSFVSFSVPFGTLGIIYIVNFRHRHIVLSLPESFERLRA